SATGVATINSGGLAASVATGNATITAAIGSITGSTTITVTSPFTLTGSMADARFLHTATLLSNGMVLIAGGCGTSGLLASAELYNPATGTFSDTGSMTTARCEHTATLLANGLILITGGNNGT